MSDRKIYWRCFHCGDAFTKAQEKHAREHFGDDRDAVAACQIRIGGEAQLIRKLRQQERELNAYRSEDGQMMRAWMARSADHQVALRREEERGYEKGVRDGRKYPEDHPQGASHDRD